MQSASATSQVPTLSGVYPGNDSSEARTSETSSMLEIVAQTANIGLREILFFEDAGDAAPVAVDFVDPSETSDFNMTESLLRELRAAKASADDSIRALLGPGDEKHRPDITSHNTLLCNVQTIARVIVQTPYQTLVNTSVAIDFMRHLRDLMAEHRQLIVGSFEAEDLLQRLLFLFAPVARIAESLSVVAYLKQMP
ncbi:hypothetical protein HK105_206907 [Polyrhizophydium stewartii]|uniref:Uncharacterized protein n=1 Tax=Polyrhizophydium stewartii TaxID=2732419 RepID=A0ABR4N255_9FUNG